MNTSRRHSTELDIVRRHKSVGQFMLISHGRGKVIDIEVLAIVHVIFSLPLHSLWTMGVKITKYL